MDISLLREVIDWLLGLPPKDVPYLERIQNQLCLWFWEGSAATETKQLLAQHYQHVSTNLTLLPLSQQQSLLRVPRSDKVEQLVYCIDNEEMGETCDYAKLVESMKALQLDTQNQEYRLRALIILTALGKIRD